MRMGSICFRTTFTQDSRLVSFAPAQTKRTASNERR